MCVRESVCVCERESVCVGMCVQRRYGTVTCTVCYQPLSSDYMRTVWTNRRRRVLRATDLDRTVRSSFRAGVPWIIITILAIYLRLSCELKALTLEIN